jgi:hypothetical protein
MLQTSTKNTGVLPEDNPKSLNGSDICTGLKKERKKSLVWWFKCFIPYLHMK